MFAKPALLPVIGMVVSLGLAGCNWFGKSPKESEPNQSPTLPAAPDPVLDEAQREYIWQVEHHVLLLGKHWFHDLADALAGSDGAALTRLLAADFSGSRLARPAQENLANDFIQVARLKDAGHGAALLDRDGFVAMLLELRKQFANNPRVKVFAKTMAPKTRADLDSSWEGDGVLRMWGVTAAAEPAEVVLQLHFRLPRPTDRKAAGWLQYCAVTQEQQAKAKGFLFRDATRERNIDPARFHDNWVEKTTHGASGGVHLCDFNRDGIIDVLIVDLRCYALYQGLPGGKFKDVTAAYGLPEVPPPGGTSSHPAFVDIDGDGWEDLILADRIYRNNLGRRFVDYTHRTNLVIPSKTTGLAIADFDGDGLMDLYVTIPGTGKAESWLNGESGERLTNQLWRNLGNWKFENVTAASKAGGGHRSVFSAVWFDANNDGRPDLYVPNEFGNGVLLLNQGNGTFREQALLNGPGDFGTMGLSAGDINNDGHIDLYLGNMYSKTGSRIIGNVKPGTYPKGIMNKMRRFVSGSQLYLNHGQDRFEPVAQPWQINDVGWAYGPALIDLDNDGFLDIFATSGYISVSRDEPDG